MSSQNQRKQSLDQESSIQEAPFETTLCLPNNETDHETTRYDLMPFFRRLYSKDHEEDQQAHRGQGGSGHAIFTSLWGHNQIQDYRVYQRRRQKQEAIPTSSSPNVVALVTFGTHLNGHDGIVHGGILSMIMDDVLGFAYESLGDVDMAVTANLNVNYRAPVPAGTSVQVMATLTERDGRKLYWSIQMTSISCRLSSTSEEEQEVDVKTNNPENGIKSSPDNLIYVEGTSLYIIPRSAVST